MSEDSAESGETMFEVTVNNRAEEALEQLRQNGPDPAGEA